MKKVKIFIDGKAIITTSDQTILQVCQSIGINIPTLCYDDQLEPFTSCFLCIVEVEGDNNFVPSCGTKVQNGMRVITESENIWKARKMALELILSNHYADCLGPCKLECPAGVDVQGYLALAAMGKFRDAIELIKRNNPLPTVCGRVCTRPCEMNCRRNFVDEAAAIDHVKRFIADMDLNSPERYFPEVKPETGKRVAIIGAGPAGLSCAYYLRQEGHSVDIFDAKQKAGGMLRWGIPRFRLPEEIIDKEIEGITNLGVKIHLNQSLGKNFSIDQLFEQGYQSIFLGLGAQASTSMGIENEEVDGVLPGVDFLQDIKLKKISRLEGKVAVIGGGNTAMDAARSALRLGADSVTIVYRRTLQEMPASEIEIEEAKEEGVEFKFLTAPVKVLLNQKNRAKGIECIQMKLGEPDASGRRRPVPIEGSNFVIELDWVIAAIGQKPDLEFAGKDKKLVNIRQTKWGTLEIRSGIMDTNIPGIFAGGDVVLGPATAIEAISDGKKAAEAIHKYLTGEKLVIAKKPFLSRKDNFKKLSETDFIQIPKTSRAKMAIRDAKIRKNDWEEIELGLKPDQVYNEAIRCLECGCQAFYECDLQVQSTQYEVTQKNYLGEFHDLAKDSTHPFIEIDLNKCILCGRCVRICDEVMGLGVFGFVQRGFEAKVKPALEKSLVQTDCISCGQCVETCPTGAIVDKVDASKPGPWILQKLSSICQYCSIGCGMKVNILKDRILKISADKSVYPNKFGNLCERGRYGFRYVNDKERLTEPLIKRNGKLVPVSWQTALDFAAHHINNLRNKNTRWAVFGSPHSTNEENYLLQKFARVVLHTNNIGSFSHPNNLPLSLLRASMSRATFDEIGKGDFIMLYDFDPLKTHPVLYIEIQKALRQGKNVFAVCPPDSILARKTKYINILESEKAAFLRVLTEHIASRLLSDSKVSKQRERISKSVKKITDKFHSTVFHFSQDKLKKLAIEILKAKSPLFIINRETANPELIYWINCLMYLLGKEQAILSLPAAVNYQGMLDMGLLAEYLPGYLEITNKKDRHIISKLWQADIPVEAGFEAWGSLERFNKAEISGLFLWNQDPLGCAELPISSSEQNFVIVADIFKTKSTQVADVVFPLVPFSELSGSITNAESRIIHFQKVINSRTGRSNWSILQELARRLNYQMNYGSTEDIFQEITRIIPGYQKKLVYFKNEFLPGYDEITSVEIMKFAYGGNYLEKWFEEFHRQMFMTRSTEKTHHSRRRILLDG
jgi:formate dehydrogenase major subunit